MLIKGKCRVACWLSHFNFQLNSNSFCSIYVRVRQYTDILGILRYHDYNFINTEIPYLGVM